MDEFNTTATYARIRAIRKQMVIELLVDNLKNTIFLVKSGFDFWIKTKGNALALDQIRRSGESLCALFYASSQRVATVLSKYKRYSFQELETFRKLWFDILVKLVPLLEQLIKILARQSSVSKKAIVGMQNTIYDYAPLYFDDNIFSEFKGLMDQCYPLCILLQERYREYISQIKDCFSDEDRLKFYGK